MICDNFAREISAAIQAEGWTDVSFSTFPSAFCRPQNNWDNLRAETARAPTLSDNVCILGGQCLRNFGNSASDSSFCQVISLEQCFHLFIGKDILEASLRRGRQVMTPGWVAHWRGYVEQLWGFDRATAREFFQESTSGLLLLDSGVDSDAEAHLAEMADFVGLPSERIYIGLEFFRLFLNKLVLDWHRQMEKKDALAAIAQSSRQSADYAMAFDLIGQLTGIDDEEQVIEKILLLFNILLAPTGLTYVSVVNGKPGRVWPCAIEPCDGDQMMARFQFEADYAWTEETNGFRLKIAHNTEILGLIELTGFAFPQYKEHYLNIALVITRVCGLAINNTRIHQSLVKANQDLEHSLASEQRVARTDTVTGVNNRLSLFEHAAREFNAATRYQHALSVILFDIDHFKQVNDAFGHAVGDMVLENVAQVARAQLRGADIIGRYGGEEFVVLLPMTTAEQAYPVAERIRSAIAAIHVPMPQGDVTVTLSIGVAAIDAPDDSLDCLLDRGDRAMYAAKQAGRNRIRVFSAAAQEDA
jgi:diguanylate cyclase (GGDEF)-like protein